MSDKVIDEKKDSNSSDDNKKVSRRTILPESQLLGKIDVYLEKLQQRSQGKKNE